MRAVICRSFGPVAALQLEEVPPPEVASGTVAIDVAAAGVNFPDGLIVQGKYQAQPSFPFVPGSEAAGIVRAIGAGVEGFDPATAWRRFAASAAMRNRWSRRLLRSTRCSKPCTG